MNGTDEGKSITGKPRRGHWIPVVAGLVRKGPLFLVGQRPENHSLAGKWEFPGGKIEAGEAPEIALQRELQEELGIEAEVGPLRMSATHTYGEVNILILFFEILYWKGEPKAKHHTQIAWLSAEELRQREIPETNRKIFDRLIATLGQPCSK